MKRLLLLTSTLVWLLALSSYAQKQENTPINILRMVYWEVYVSPISGLSVKYKKTLTYAQNQSQIKIDYIGPPSSDNDIPISGEKREQVVNKDGKEVTKVTVAGNASQEAIFPEDSWDTYKDFQKNEFMSIDAVSITGSNGKFDYYLLREPRPDFGWRITEERKSIGGYECIKAVSQPFRGRVYEAWFAPAIPVSDGPWKLSGLPGLILEAEDADKEYLFVMESLVLNPEEKIQVENHHLKRKHPVLTWEQYKAKVNEQTEKMIKYNASKGVVTSNYKTSKKEKIQ